MFIQAILTGAAKIMELVVSGNGEWRVVLGKRMGNISKEDFGKMFWLSL